MKKKRIIVTTLLAAVLLLSVPSRAQVFIMEDDEGSNRINTNGYLPGIPNIDVGYDQYDDPSFAPLGSEVLILGCLGGIYLLGRRRKERE